MNAAEVYQDYLALKAHFTSKYNYHQYNGKIRASTTSKSYVSYRLFYEKIAKHPDPHGFLLANILDDPKAFVRNIAYSADAQRLYLDYRAIQDSLSYRFRSDLTKISGTLKDALKFSSSHPPIVLLYFSKEITFETLCIVAAESGKLELWDGYYLYDPVMQEIILKIRKYLPFISYDRNKFRKIIVDNFKHAKEKV